jgi:hypothetical protein
VFQFCRAGRLRVFAYTRHSPNFAIMLGSAMGVSIKALGQRRNPVGSRADVGFDRLRVGLAFTAGNTTSTALCR